MVKKESAVLNNVSYHLLEEIKTKKGKEAIARLERVLKKERILDPSVRDQVHNTLAGFYESQGNFLDAAEAYEKGGNFEKAQELLNLPVLREIIRNPIKHARRGLLNLFSLKNYRRLMQEEYDRKEKLVQRIEDDVEAQKYIQGLGRNSYRDFLAEKFGKEDLKLKRDKRPDLLVKMGDEVPYNDSDIVRMFMAKGRFKDAEKYLKDSKRFLHLALLLEERGVYTKAGEYYELGAEQTNADVYRRPSDPLRCFMHSAEMFGLAKNLTRMKKVLEKTLKFARENIKDPCIFAEDCLQISKMYAKYGLKDEAEQQTIIAAKAFEDAAQNHVATHWERQGYFSNPSPVQQDYRTAADLWKSVGNLERATQDYEQAGELEKAKKIKDSTRKVAAIVGIIGGISLLSTSITGNVIGNATVAASSVLGAALLVVGLTAGFFWVSNRKSK